jgi:glycosidase
LDDFQDETLHQRKKVLIKQNIKEDDFMDAQIKQNPINSRSLMQWNVNKNGGFSETEKTISPVSESFQEINVKNQFKDSSSVLYFYKTLIESAKSSNQKDFITNAKTKVSIGSIIMNRIIKIN